MTDLIRVTRGDDVADIRPEWLEQWRGWGWAEPVSALSRDQISTMERATVLELLEARGWAGDKRLAVEKLREALIDIPPA